MTFNNDIIINKYDIIYIIQGDEPERLVSGSDDFTLFLWTPSENKKHVARMTGEAQLFVDDVLDFSLHKFEKLERELIKK